jgi:hypothetical protein
MEKVDAGFVHRFRNRTILFLLSGLFFPFFSFSQNLKYQFHLQELVLLDPVHLKWVPEAAGQKAHIQINSDTSRTLLFLPGADEGYAWGQARYLVMEVEHDNLYSAILHLDFFQHLYDDNPRVRLKLGILPGLRTQVLFPISYLSAQSIYIPKYPRQLKGTLEGNFLLPEEVGRVAISVKPNQFPDFMPGMRIYNMYLSDALPQPLPPPPGPLVDSMGQRANLNWPGKSKSVRDLNRDIAGQIRDSKGKDKPMTRFLGFQKKRFKATGFFRTHHDGKRWWLVDPQGNAFLSSGVDCMRSYSSGPVVGNEDLFSWLPFGEEKYREQFAVARKQVQFNFLGANLSRALGPDWRKDWYGFARRFLLDNNFNTIGNWSDTTFCRTAKLPWVFPMSGFPETEKTVFRDFPDVFDPTFRDSVRKFARQLEPLKNDSFLIGYFLRNEPEWAFGEHNLAAEMLVNPWQSYSRKALISWLESRYKGDIAKLNLAWQEDFKSFQSLDSGTIRIESRDARAELRRFTEILVDTMIGMVCREVKKVDPNHLNLGLRYAWISSDLCYRAGSYFDVFSVNGYGMNAPSQTKTIEKRSGKPVLIGEFHIGTLDRGLPASGIAAALNTEERGWAIRHYFEEAFSRPEVIGVHYFQLYDQPLTGRFDGENYQIGFLDICNQPYSSVLHQVKEANKGMYRVARRKRQPFQRKVYSILPIYY